MKHRKSHDTRGASDQLVEASIKRLRDDVQNWALQNELWFDSGFTDYLAHTGREPSTLPVVTRMYSEGELSRALLGEGPPEIEMQFSELLEKHGCWYEFDDHCTLNIYPDEESDYSDFSSYFHWQWICSLVKEDIGDVYAELYSHFGKRPDDLYNLSWRDYEILLAEIFKTQGFEAQLGPGRNDGGVDITLLQRDPIGDIVTVVQAKKYSPKNKIQPADVQALYGVQMADQAQKALFVTTSTYLPAAQKFAARANVSMPLATSCEVAEWCSSASSGIIEDKSSLLQPGNLSKIFQGIGTRQDSRIVRAHSGYNCIRNEFAFVAKESKHAALLLKLPGKTVAHDGFGQAGIEIPLLDPTLPNFSAAGVCRAKREKTGDRVTYWDGYHLYSVWDGEPCEFNLYD